MEKIETKWKSRTFLLVIMWFALAVLAMIIQIALKSSGITLPIESIVYFAGGISLAYVGIKQPMDSYKETRLANKTVTVKGKFDDREN